MSTWIISYILEHLQGRQIIKEIKPHNLLSREHHCAAFFFGSHACFSNVEKFDYTTIYDLASVICLCIAASF